MRTKRGLSLPLAVLLTVIIAILLWWCSNRVWLRGEFSDPLRGSIPGSATGRQLAPLTAACAIVALAAGLMMAVARTSGRRVSAAVLLLSAAAAAYGALDFVLRPLSGTGLAKTASASSNSVPQIPGVGGLAPPAAVVTGLRASIWPWVAVACALGLMALGVAIQLRISSWGKATGRFEKPSAQPGSLDLYDSVSAWDAQNLGQDPTAPLGATEVSGRAALPDRPLPLE